MHMCYCAIGCQHSTLNRLFGCVLLAKSKQVIGAHFQTLLSSFLIFWCSSIFK